MSLTVGQLIELLKGYPAEMTVAVGGETISDAERVDYLYSPTEEGPGTPTAVGILTDAC